MSGVSIPEAYISPSTIEYFKENIKKCRDYKRNYALSDNFIRNISTEIEVTKKLSGYSTEGIGQNLSGLFRCDDEFILQFKKRIGRDNMAYHRYMRDQIKNEIKDFEDKGLTGNFQLSKYMEYAKKNDVDLEVDPKMVQMYLNKAEEAKKRKATCSDIMNLKEPLSVDEPRDQGSMRWCFASVASDLLSHALGKNLSSVYVANKYNDKFINRIFRFKEGGFTADAMDEIIDSGGVCLEKDMPSEGYNFSDGGDIGSLFRNVQSLSDKYTQRPSVVIGSDNKMAVDGYTKQHVVEDLCTENQEMLIQLAEVMPNLTLDKLVEVLMKSGSNAFQDLTKTCPLDLDPELKKLVVRKNANKRTMFSTIDQQLDQGNILGINYKTKMLAEYDKSGAKRHASSVVGRRFNEKTLSCEYMIRNSWGKTCAPYAEDYECKKGHVWIAEDFLKYNNPIDEVNYVEKQ
jgi:hypothetical protein